MKVSPAEMKLVETCLCKTTGPVSRCTPRCFLTFPNQIPTAFPIFAQEHSLQGTNKTSHNLIQNMTIIFQTFLEKLDTYSGS